MENLRRQVLEGEVAKELPIVKNLLRKKQLLQNGDPNHSEIKTALIIDGGGMRGVYGGGAVIGLKQAGLTDAFDYVVGCSAGAADCAYFLSGQPEIGTSIYFEDLANENFINPFRIRKIMDIDYLDWVFRNVKPLDQEKVRSSRSHFFIGVTNAKTGQGEFLDMKDSQIDVINAIRASTAIPLAYNKPVIINGIEYCDGSIGCGLPISFALQKDCTDILVVTNRPFGEKSPLMFSEKLLVNLFMRHFSSEFRSAHLKRNENYNKSLEDINEMLDSNSDLNLGILCPTDMPLGRFSRDSSKMRLVAQQALQQTLTLFAPTKT